jgi:hypothetical protein
VNTTRARADELMTPEVRATVVRHLGAALAAAWRDQRRTNERPVRLDLAAGRDVGEGADRDDGITHGNPNRQAR